MRDDPIRREGSISWLQRRRWLRADELDPVQRETWKQARQVFSVEHDGVELYPGYQFLRAGRMLQPRPVIRTVLEALGPVDHPWFLVDWFLRSNARLVATDGGSVRNLSPEEALERGLDDDVVRAANLRARQTRALNDMGEDARRLGLNYDDF